ncbi:MAG: hypothetical protein MI974_18590 [Chitinophagales bacterium]|nr:hypothetical protein [Chitinophagales bacterium]
MKTPKYCIVGVRPVKAESSANGGLGIYAFNWETGKFDLNFHYLEHIYGLYKGDTETKEISKEEFDKYVEKMRVNRG